jgi:3-hydroxyisobutyrate dehydrogenase
MAELKFDIAVLGCGIMGSGIARRACEQGLRTIAWDRTFSRAQAVGGGVEAAERLEDAAADASVVVTMLADADAVLDVMGDRGGLECMTTGSTWVQMATIGIDGTRRAQELAEQRRDMVFIDAPVSGSKAPAEQGRLLILASSDAASAPDSVTRLFEAIGQRTVWLGGAGQGTRMKLLMNAWLAALMEGVAETLALGDSLGLTPQQFEACITGSALAAPFAIAKIEKIISGATAHTEFPLKWATKDVRLALGARRENGHGTLPLLEGVANAWERAIGLGLGNADISAAYLALIAEASVA